jgi:hypothetical protein
LTGKKKILRSTNIYHVGGGFVRMEDGTSLFRSPSLGQAKKMRCSANSGTFAYTDAAGALNYEFEQGV